MEPNQVANQAPVQSAPVVPKDSIVQDSGTKKGGKGAVIGMVIFAVLALGGIGFGVWVWMDGNTQKDALNNQISDLKKQNGELLDKMAEAGGSSDVNTEDYIYVGEWGVKFKIPDNLQYVSYDVHDFDYGDYAGISLCVSGATTGHGDEKPSFVKDPITGSGLTVCLSKNTKSAEEGPWYGTSPIGEYYIQGPQAIIDEANADWESESVSAISNMLSTENMSNI